MFIYSYNKINQLTSDSSTDASGDKLSKSGTVTELTEYINGVQYGSNTGSYGINFISTPEGRAERKADGSYRYEYDLKDHLGNVRVSIQQNPSTQLADTIQKDDYYPFGLRYSKLAGDNKYLYNSKELEEEYNEYDYGSRRYNALIGRWTSIDPLAEKYRRFSPYNYGGDNPIRFIDPDGMEFDDFFNMGPLDELFDINGKKIGEDEKGKNGKARIITDSKEVAEIKDNTKNNITTQSNSINSGVSVSDAALSESLNVLSRTQMKTADDPSGGLHGESSIVMNDGNILQGKSGKAAFINSNNELQADETLPGLPSGSTPSDAEATIHSHVTGTILQNGQIYSHDALQPSNLDATAFKQFGMNIIVGPLGQATATSNQNTGVSINQPGNGVVIYKGGTAVPTATLTIKAVQRILKP